MGAEEIISLPIDGEDPLSIGREDFETYSVIFEELGAHDGMISGSIAAPYLVRSALERLELGTIWYLVDKDKDGFLSLNEFAVAIHMCRCANGYTEPEDYTDTYQFERRPSQQEDPSSWQLSEDDKDAFGHLFEDTDSSGSGFLSGMDLAAFFEETGIQRTEVSVIIRLADVDGDERLNEAEFAVAVFLCQKVADGQSLPETLPALLKQYILSASDSYLSSPPDRSSTDTASGYGTTATSQSEVLQHRNLSDPSLRDPEDDTPARERASPSDQLERHGAPEPEDEEGVIGGNEVEAETAETAETETLGAEAETYSRAAMDSSITPTTDESSVRPPKRHLNPSAASSATASQRFNPFPLAGDSQLDNQPLASEARKLGAESPPRPPKSEVLRRMPDHGDESAPPPPPRPPKSSGVASIPSTPLGSDGPPQPPLPPRTSRRSSLGESAEATSTNATSSYTSSAGNSESTRLRLRNEGFALETEIMQLKVEQDSLSEYARICAEQLRALLHEIAETRLERSRCAGGRGKGLSPALTEAQSARTTLAETLASLSAEEAAVQSEIAALSLELQSLTNAPASSRTASSSKNPFGDAPSSPKLGRAGNSTAPVSRAQAAAPPASFNPFGDVGKSATAPTSPKGSASSSASNPFGNPFSQPASAPATPTPTAAHGNPFAGGFPASAPPTRTMSDGEHPLGARASSAAPQRQGLSAGAPPPLPVRQGSKKGPPPSVTIIEEQEATGRQETGSTSSVEELEAKILGAGPLISGLRAVSIFPWRALKDNQLTFGKGETIVVRKQEESWWAGVLDDKVGWFPKSYVRLVSGRDPRAAASGAATPDFLGVAKRSSGDGGIGSGGGVSGPVFSAPATPTHMTGTKSVSGSPMFFGQGGPSSASSSSSISLPTADPEAAAPAAPKVYVAKYAYEASERGELSFKAGDRISVSKSEGRWWEGECNGKRGQFPANYVTEPK